METQQAKAPASNSSVIASVSRVTVHSLIKIIKLDPIFFSFGLFSSDGFFIADPECLFLPTKNANILPGYAYQQRQGQFNSVQFL